MMRIGIGRDLHKLEAGRRFLLGGVEIPAAAGEQAHSDGDVLIHAIIDAILGAAALGDIGELFPSSCSRYKDASSVDLLKIAHNKVKESGFSIVNIDCVVSAEEPHVLPYRTQICENLAGILGIESSAVFVKGKTGEKLGDIGLKRAVEAFAVCLLEKNA
jgi:2-C-methyl-D-erythritol 2,4-cyclodiphosphate synthase